jgi:hypothetical protein
MSNRYFDLAFPPSGLAAHAGPAGGTEKRNEFGKLACISRFPHESAERMFLPGVAAVARGRRMPNLTVRHTDLIRTLTETAKVHIEGALSVQRAQRTDAIANAAREYAEIRPLRHPTLRLQFGWSEKLYGDPSHRLTQRIERKRQWRFSADGSQRSAAETLEGAHDSCGLWSARIEVGHADLEDFAGPDCAPIQVSCADDEGTGPVLKAAWAGAAGGRPEDALVRQPVPIQGGAECSAQNVPVAAPRKVYFPAGAECQTQRIKRKCQGRRYFDLAFP